MARRFHQSKKERRHERMVAEHEPRNMEGRFEDEGYEHMSKRDHMDGRHLDGTGRHDAANRPSYHTMNEEMYAGVHKRRRQEMEDAGYIREDHTAIANLPQQVMMKPYPYAGAEMPSPLDDTIRGVDHQIHMENRKRKEHFSPHKY